MTRVSSCNLSLLFLIPGETEKKSFLSVGNEWEGLHFFKHFFIFKYFIVLLQLSPFLSAFALLHPVQGNEK